ncbi:hypothetical protein HPB47_021687 [Ixodes persulcatus]|uniref:Uncharacterized protein n=1 Tax=Ixodes persulcatus TaxID=34615 RepID=A0AC60QE22_IXOPE|nr:hypothetical protein HPB47_021687 [Ixodes persulcatus]
MAAPSAHVAARSATSLLQRHSDILDNLDKWQASYKELSQDKTRKKYCFDLLKAVTIPVNALANSLSVRDKLDQLTSILSGKPFQSGSRTISTSTHPLAQRFCLDKVAEKIVLQGEEQINSNADSAFPVAALAVGLWCKFPEIGDLLLGHFYLRCPFLVPVFFRKDPSQSETDYLRFRILIGLIIRVSSVAECLDFANDAFIGTRHCNVNVVVRTNKVIPSNVGRTDTSHSRSNF